MFKIVLTTVFFAVCLQFASGIRCYDCSSVNNTMCLDPTIYDRETLQRYLRLAECGEGVYSQGQKEFFCRKIVQTILHKNHDSEVRVARGCGWVRSHRECYKADNEDHMETVCQCFEDGCNGAATVFASWSLLIGGILLLNKW